MSVFDYGEAAPAFYTIGEAEQFHAALAEALDLAREIDSQRADFRPRGFWPSCPPGPRTKRRDGAWSMRCWSGRPQGISLRTASSFLGFCGLSLLAWGDRDRAESLWLRLDEMAERTADPGVTQVSLACRCTDKRWRTVDSEEAIATGAALAALAEDTAISSADDRNEVSAGGGRPRVPSGAGAASRRAPLWTL